MWGASRAMIGVGARVVKGSMMRYGLPTVQSVAGCSSRNSWCYRLPLASASSRFMSSSTPVEPNSRVRIDEKRRHGQQNVQRCADVGEVDALKTERAGSPPKDPRSNPSGVHSPSSLTASLTDSQTAAIRAHKAAISSVLHALEGVDGSSPHDVAMVKAQIDRLDDGLFLLVVVGEYNSGKSSCINALLGKSVVAEGVVPTTAEVMVLRYGSAEDIELESMSSSPAFSSSSSTSAVSTQSPPTGPSESGVVVAPHDIDLLKTITLVDSPGTNAIDRRHEALTKEYLPMCDLVLFVTSADRPFSESERVFLKSIRAWGKKCVLVVNKIDILPGVDAEREVVAFVQSSSRALLGSGAVNPKVFPVSSRRALEAKQSSTGASGPHWDASGFEALERYISHSLDADARLKIKLESVASVSSAVGETYLEHLEAESAVLESDRAALNRVEELVQNCQKSIDSGFPAHFARVDNVLLELLERADNFFDSHVALRNVSMLMKKRAVEEAFIEQVLQETERDVERRARSLAEWAADKLSRNFADVASNFSRRVGERKGELGRNPDTHGHNDVMIFESPPVAVTSTATDAAPDQLVSVLGDAAAHIAATYKPAVEAKRIADALSSSILTAVTLELGALGVFGTCLTLSTLDPVGAVSTGALAVGGLLVLPRRRQVLRTEMRARVASMRIRLEKDMRARVQEQVSVHSERVRAAVEPFASHTKERVKANSVQSTALRASLKQLHELS